MLIPVGWHSDGSYAIERDDGKWRIGEVIGIDKVVLYGYSKRYVDYWYIGTFESVDETLKHIAEKSQDAPSADSWFKRMYARFKAAWL